MEKREDIINETVGRIIALPGSEKVEFIYLYGSAAYGKSHEGSDIDICICDGNYGPEEVPNNKYSY